MKSFKHLVLIVLLVGGLAACNQGGKVETINGDDTLEKKETRERGDTSTNQH